MIINCGPVLSRPILGRNISGSLRLIYEYGTSLDITTIQVNSALHPSGVAKSSTSFGWGKGGKVTSAGWQVNTM